MLQQNQSDGPDSAKLDQALDVVAARRLLFDGDFGVADRHHAEQQRAAEPADDSTKRHEGKEHQHSAIAFSAGGLEDFDPGKPGADAERGAAEDAQHQTQQRKQRDFHECGFGSMPAKPRVGRGRGEQSSTPR